MSMLHWVNDGLLTVFFLVVGLEVKREMTVGHLASRRSAALPIAAALGGMVVPARFCMRWSSLRGRGRTGRAFRWRPTLRSRLH
jgi:Na+/H+ antiporter NhaA